MTRIFARLSPFLILMMTSACQLGSYGQSGPYYYTVQNPIAVQIPPNAPSVIQQFRPATGEVGREASGEHPGIDIYEARGTPILAAADGTVIASYSEPSYGQRIVIRHGLGPRGAPIQTVYKHLNSRAVQTGQKVRRGQQIGGLGNSGLLAAGILHLHFEVHEKQGARTLPRDPHLFWAGGVGRITCFDPNATVPSGHVTLSYPVKCKEPN